MDVVGPTSGTQVPLLQGAGYPLTKRDRPQRGHIIAEHTWQTPESLQPSVSAAAEELRCVDE